MSQFYHTSAQRSTAVNLALTGYFTGPNDLNLVLIKNSFIEVYDITSEGLRVVRDIPLNGTILTALLFRRKGYKQDSLCIVTLRADIIILECKRTDDSVEFITIVRKNIEERGHHMLHSNVSAFLDPSSTYLALRLFQNTLTLIEINHIPNFPGGGLDDKRIACVSLDEPNAIDLTFVHGCDDVTIAMIYEEQGGAHLKLCEYNRKEMKLNPLPVPFTAIETTSRMLIPVPKPFNGFLVVGDEMISYHCLLQPHITACIPHKTLSRMAAYTQIDSSRFLIGNICGELFMVRLTASASNASSSSFASPDGLSVEFLGFTSVPESLVYLDNGVVFIGSYFGDSQLIRLRSEMDPDTKCYFDIYEEYPNLGPITDMAFVENEGQNQLITCSGFSRDGSIRIIRNGIGIQEISTITQEDMNGVWCFPCTSDTYDDAMVCSIQTKSRTVSIVGDDLKALKLEGFVKSDRTLYCATVYPQGHKQVPSPLLLQVTNKTLWLIGIQNLYGKGCLASWDSPTGMSISTVTALGDLIVVASGSKIFALRITGSPEAPVFTQVGQNELPSEVACIDITPFNVKSSRPSASSATPYGDSMDDKEPEYAAVGLWLGEGVSLLKLPSLEVVFNDPLPKEVRSTGAVILPRSIAIAQFEELLYLFCVSGDGTLFFYNVTFGEGKICLRDRKSMKIGSTCRVRLVQWNSRGKRYVFLCSNRPYIIYENRNKLVFANVNIKNISYMSPLNCGPANQTNPRGWGPVISGSRICMITPKGVTIGSVDSLQKLHVRKIPLYETPRRLAVQESTKSIAVLTMRHGVLSVEGQIHPPFPSISSDRSGKIPQTICPMPKISSAKSKLVHVDSYSLLIFCQATWQLKHIYRLAQGSDCYEAGMSLCSSDLGQNNAFFYILGTAIMLKDEPEPKKGRIHIIRWDRKTEELHQISLIDVLGTPCSLRGLDGHLVAGIGSSVRVYNFEENKLSQETVMNDNVVALIVRTHKDHVLVGDLMRNCKLLQFSLENSALETVGFPTCPRYVSAMEMIDEKHFIVADMEGNIFLMAPRAIANLEEPIVSSVHGTTAATNPTPMVTGSESMEEGKPLPFNLASTSSDSSSGATTSEGEAQSGESTSQTATTQPAAHEVKNPKKDSKALVDYAYMNTGQAINVFVKGNMNTVAAEPWNAIAPTHMLYGSTTGSLGMMINISPIFFVFLKTVEDKLRKLIQPFGGLNQEVYRACKDCLSNLLPTRNIIDGELVETFLELDRCAQDKIVKDLRIPVTLESFGAYNDASYDETVPTRECTVADLIRVIEELTGLH